MLPLRSFSLWLGAVLVATTGCKSPSSAPLPDRPLPPAASAIGEMDPVERGKRYAWPDDANGFHTGMTAAEFDAQCAGAKHSIDVDGSRTCLRVPGSQRDAQLFSARFCGATICELLVSDLRAGQSDAAWLATFEEKRAALTKRYGPPRVEETTANGCEGERLVACTGDGRAVRKYSWAFMGRKHELAQFALVNLGLTPIGIAVTYQNEAWLEREHQRDAVDSKRR